MTFFVLFLLLRVGSSQSAAAGRGDVYTNHWAVRVTGGPEQAERIAAKYGYRNLGQVETTRSSFDCLLVIGCNDVRNCLFLRLKPAATATKRPHYC